jgi:hypothetical protein
MNINMNTSINTQYPIQRPKIGFLLKDVSSSELAYNILRKGSETNIDTFIFFENVSRPCISSLVPLAHISEAYIFDGPLIATCLQTANKLIPMYSPKPKFFFLNDLEWLHIPFQYRQYESFASVYLNKELTLICRSESHKQLTEMVWNRKVKHIVERYNFYEENFIKPILEKSNNIYPQIERTPIKFTNSIMAA